MPGEWRRYCRGESDLQVDGERIVVGDRDARRHRVSVTETADTYELEGVVVRAAGLDVIPDAALRALERNRTVQLVGFRIDRSGKLVGHAWVPKAGLTPEEFCFMVRRVAVECDRFEYQLTGKDVE